MALLTDRQATIFKVVGYEIQTNEVARFHESTARQKHISSPARTSKSYAGHFDAYLDPDVERGLGVLEPGINPHFGLAKHPDKAKSQLIWVVAPNYDLAKEFDYFWEILVQRRVNLGFDNLYKLGQCMNSAATGKMRITLQWGKNARGEDVETVIEVKSATNEKSLQSEEVHVCILSEAKEVPERVWDKFLKTRCGRTIWPTTPSQQARYIFDEMELGKENPHLGIESFYFTPHANPTYLWDRFWIEHQKAEAAVLNGEIVTHPTDANAACSATNGHNCFDELTDCAAAKSPAFAEEFLGLWTFYQGRVVPLQEEEGPNGEPAHVVHEDPDWLRYATWVFACDHGYRDPAVGAFWAISPDGQVYLADSIYERGLSSYAFVDRTGKLWKEQMKRYELMNDRADYYLGDPAQPDVADHFQKLGLPLWNVDKNQQRNRHVGHLALMNLFSYDHTIGRSRFTMHARNTGIIGEWRKLRYSEKTKSENAPAAFKGRDDAYDMARYFAAAGIVGVDRSEDVRHFELARLAAQAQNAKYRKRRTVNPAPAGYYVSGSVSA